jgi:prepilin-type processing-associated H-X9-DG protein
MDVVDSRRTTLLVVMIAIALGLVLAGGAAILNWSMDRPRRQSQCGKNQSQIIGAMVAYFTSEGIENWLPPEHPIATSSTIATSARFKTTKYLEVLAASLTLPNGLFKCAQSRSLAPSSKPRPSDPASTWGWEAGRTIGYALDWAAPADASWGRPMTADRDPNAHPGAVMVAFGDAHVTKLKQVSGPARVVGALVTESVDGTPISAIVVNPSDDDIYTPFGDAGDPLTPGKGDPLRAWVK